MGYLFNQTRDRGYYTMAYPRGIFLFKGLIKELPQSKLFIWIIKCFIILNKNKNIFTVLIYVLSKSLSNLHNKSNLVIVL